PAVRLRGLPAIEARGGRAGRPEQQGEVTAGRVPHRPDVVRIDAVLLRVRPEEPDGGAGVLDLGRELVRRGEPVADRDGDVPAGGDRLDDAGAGLAVLAAGRRRQVAAAARAPPAAVHAYDRGVR